MDATDPPTGVAEVSVEMGESGRSLLPSNMNRAGLSSQTTQLGREGRLAMPSIRVPMKGTTVDHLGSVCGGAKGALSAGFTPLEELRMPRRNDLAHPATIL